MMEKDSQEHNTDDTQLEKAIVFFLFNEQISIKNKNFKC